MDIFRIYLFIGVEHLFQDFDDDDDDLIWFSWQWISELESFKEGYL